MNAPGAPLARAPWWAGLRAIPLVVFAVPFVPALFLALAGGHRPLIAGSVAGLAGIVAAMALLRRAQRGDARRASVLLGVGTGLAAGFAGGTGGLGGAVLGLMAWGGAKLLYEGVTEVEPAPPPAPAVPPPPEDPLRGRVAALRFADSRLLPAVDALDRLRVEVAARPERGVEARRVLVLGLDGLERIAGRLRVGIEPPGNLDAALDDLARAADTAAHGLRAADTEALEIQVKVLRDRLREGGAA
ncbi:hypothetical protein ACE7GA_20910 [Roseomonas sp. CCTCC AB2023176]|uniref:hypothetical protein n=1 Tax=Roseomonas sp. CCTCC AB2023176 TaxID=3342640 RepID=UPI0035D7CAFC